MEEQKSKEQKIHSQNEEQEKEETKEDVKQEGEMLFNLNGNRKMRPIS